MRARSAIIILLLLLAVPAFADFSGAINFSNSGNRSTSTGIWAYTVNLCNSTSNCMPQGAGLSCFLDYDNFSSGFSYGWCNASSITNCYHNDSAYATSTNICITNLTYSTCTSGNWSAAPLNCSSGQTCPSTLGTPGNCTGTSSTTTTGSSGGSTTTTDRTPSIIFTSAPVDFDIVQGGSTTRVVITKNNGNVTLYNVTLSVSLDWAVIEPVKWNQSAKNNETAFTINFTAPEDAEVKKYSVTLTASTHNSSAGVSKAFYINVNPSNRTVQEQIFPEYEQYISSLFGMEANMMYLEEQGADVEELKSLLLNAKNKLSQANESLENKDYFTAKQLMDDAKGLLDAASNRASSTTIPSTPPVDFTFIIIIILVVAGVGGFVAYILLPPKPEKGKIITADWNIKEKKSMFRIFRRKKKNIANKK